MKVFEQYLNSKEDETPEFKFPVRVSVETKWMELKFRLQFTDNRDETFTTEWMWNLKSHNEKNNNHIKETLKKVEDDINASIQRDLRISAYKRMQREARINSLFTRF